MAARHVSEEGALLQNKRKKTFSSTFYQYLFTMYPDYVTLFKRFNLLQTLRALSAMVRKLIVHCDTSSAEVTTGPY